MGTRPAPTEAWTAAVLAVDGGNSKADLALVGADGTLLAAAHGPTISHQAVGLERGMANLAALAAAARAEVARAEVVRADVAGVEVARPKAPRHDLARTEADRGHLAGGEEPLAELGVFCLAGADFPSDIRLLRAGIERLGLAREVVVLNDTFAALRAGTTRPWGIALICGQGINGAGIAPNGRMARFDGVGDISGDWGGAGGIGDAAIAAAVRGRDGRGGRTRLERDVPAFFGVRSPAAMVHGLYTGRLDHHRIPHLTPVVFAAAGDGDVVARSIVDRLADELVTMASALIRRLGMQRLDPEVVLAGGVFRATDPAFYERIESGIRRAAPKGRMVRLTAPPVLGSALIGLDRIGAGAEAETRIAESLEAWAAGGSADAGRTPTATGQPAASHRRAARVSSR